MERQEARSVLEKMADLTGSDFSNFEIEEIEEAIISLQDREDLNDLLHACDILNECFDAVGDDLDDYILEEVIGLLDKIIDLGDDEFLELSGGEVRIIDEDSIDRIWEESLEDQIKDCYGYDLSNIPSFIEIDWSATVQNCKDDGMGHHFSSYDGSERYEGGYYIFRTN